MRSPRLRRVHAFAVALAAASASALLACSSDGSPPPAGATPGLDAGALADSAPPGSDAGGGEGGGADSGDPAGVRFHIQLDYRFDSAGFFADPVRKKALEGACRIWGKLLSDSFANVPAGTFVRVRNPETPSEPALSLNIDYEIDDIVVFVGSASLGGTTTGISSPTAGLSGVTNPSLQASLQQRFEGPVFQPWTAWISFDRDTDFYFDADPESPSTLPAGEMDFVSVALHEIGHVLGFGTADTFKSKIAGATFTGAKAQALYGGPVPLSPDLGHVPNTTLSGGQRLLMDVSDARGVRYLPTPLDRAIFEDLGFHF